jgi:hypothetical protein
MGPRPPQVEQGEAEGSKGLLSLSETAVGDAGTGKCSEITGELTFGAKLSRYISG